MTVLDSTLDVTLFAGFGSRGGPGHSTNVVRAGGGSTERIIRWDGALRQYTLSVGTTDPIQVQAIMEHIIQMRGSAFGFLVQDPGDNSTNSIHTTLTKAPPAETETDQLLPDAGDGTTQTFQLYKTYGVGGPSPITRRITKPIGSTVLAAVNGTPTTAFTVNDQTGEITFTTPPGNLQTIEWGGQFYTPVFYGLEADELLEIVQSAFDNETIAALPLEEVRDTDSVVDIQFRGGSRPAETLTDDATISTLDGTFQDFAPSGAIRTVFLPDPANTPDGVGVLCLTNSGGFSLQVDNKDGNPVQTIGIGETYLFHLAKTEFGAGTWVPQGT